MKNTRSIRLVAYLCMVVAANNGCGPADVSASAAVKETKQIVVALDLSGSQTEVKRTAAQAALNGVIDALDYGDQIVLLRVSEISPGEDSAVRWSDTVPHIKGKQENSLDREIRDRAKKSAKTVARRIFADTSAGKLRSTDLLSTLYVASEYIQDARGRRPHLILLSDMLQSAGGISMETKKGVPSAQWIAQRASTRQIPRLAGACVAVIGAEAATPRGIAVRDFWRSYFAAAGANLPTENYRLLSTSTGFAGCN